MKKLALAILVTAAIAAKTAAAHAQSVCLSNSDTAAIHVKMIAPVVNGDSAKVVAAGLPYKPSGGVILVTSDSLCSLAVTAFNAGAADSTSFVSKVYLFKLGTSGSAYVVNGAYADTPWVYEFYTPAFVRLGGMSTE